MSRRTVVLELAGEHKLARDLVAGGVFVPSCTLSLNEDVTLVLRNGDLELQVGATCVWVDPVSGSGLQLVGCDADMRQRIAALAAGMAVGDSTPARGRSPRASVGDSGAVRVGGEI